MDTICVKPLSIKAIRDFTATIREACSLDKSLYFPIVQFIEWVVCDPDSGVDLEIVPVNEMSNTYGITNTGRNNLRIREDVYVRAIENDNPRDRFTLCHEVGHYFLHQPERVEFARGNNIPKYRNPEWQANVFAAELMAPLNLIKNMPAQEIARQCGMSQQAALIRFDECRKYGV